MLLKINHIFNAFIGLLAIFIVSIQDEKRGSTVLAEKPEATKSD